MAILSHLSTLHPSNLSSRTSTHIILTDRFQRIRGFANHTLSSVDALFCCCCGASRAASIRLIIQKWNRVAPTYTPDLPFLYCSSIIPHRHRRVHNLLNPCGKDRKQKGRSSCDVTKWRKHRFYQAAVNNSSTARHKTSPWPVPQTKVLPPVCLTVGSSAHCPGLFTLRWDRRGEREREWEWSNNRAPSPTGTGRQKVVWCSVEFLRQNQCDKRPFWLCVGVSRWNTIGAMHQRPRIPVRKGCRLCVVPRWMPWTLSRRFRNAPRGLTKKPRRHTTAAQGS